MITPTNGRVVWYWPSRDDKDIGHQPQAAMVCFVHSARVVNLSVINHQGTVSPATSVPLLQDGELAPTTGHFAEWMPYQKGQAAKTEQLEEWKLVEPRPTIDKLEGLMHEYGSFNVRIEPNGDCRVKGLRA